MRKLILTLGCAAAAGAASVALGIGSGHADTGNSTLNVVGEPYAKAVAILRAQGVKATFGGSVGSDVPQAQCIVKNEKVVTNHIQLSLDCTAEAQPQAPANSGTTAVGASGTAASGAPASQTARPTPGAPGVVSVVPVPVG
ncbi:MAG: hypothetical protein U0R66_05610 [Mycobacterium sp.]